MRSLISRRERSLNKLYKSLTFTYLGWSLKRVCVRKTTIVVGCRILVIFLLLSQFGHVIHVTEALQHSSHIMSTIGSINYWPRVDVTMNPQVVGVNNLSLGFQIEWRWHDGSVTRGLARDANFRLVRLFSFRFEPCIYWNESSRTGTFNWANVDALVQMIFNIGAEPLFTLGWATAHNISRLLPPGMAVNPVTGLPYPQSYAAYAAEWVKHFEDCNFPVRYYEIMNEPASYFGYVPPDPVKLGYYVEVWNAAARAIRAINSNVFLSQDMMTLKGVLEYWMQHGDDVDSLNFHKYDCYGLPGYDDATMLTLAETRFFETSSNYWGVEEARQMWFNARGKILPVINSESNLNSAWEQGTDPRQQQMVGAVWLALVLRMGVLKGLRYNVYYSFSSSASYGKKTPTGGGGFGMINSDDDKPWYPYHVHFILGDNLDVGDLLVDSGSSSDDIRTLAWIHNGTYNLLIISKIDQPRAVYLSGFDEEVNFVKIDNTVSWENASLQTGTFNTADPLILSGYTVALLQKPAGP